MNAPVSSSIFGTTANQDLSGGVSLFKVFSLPNGENIGVAVKDNYVYIIELEPGVDASTATDNDISTLPYTTVNSVSGQSFADDLNAVASTTECTLEVNPLTKKNLCPGQ